VRAGGEKLEAPRGRSLAEFRALGARRSAELRGSPKSAGLGSSSVDNSGKVS
jgi:hypothetical protein